MPGSVANAVTTAVLPEVVAESFERVESFPLRVNTYRDGRMQTLNLAATSRKSWVFQWKGDGSTVAALDAFEAARSGPWEAFLFYDKPERVREGETPLYDETGLAGGAGKYAVRFARPVWERQGGVLGRGVIALVEVA